MKFPSLLMLIATTACTTAGVAERTLGDGIFEIRAWDGDRCRDEDTDERCRKILLPILRDQAALLCRQQKFSLSRCFRKNAVTGDRYLCVASCGVDDGKSGTAADDQGTEPEEAKLPAARPRAGDDGMFLCNDETEDCAAEAPH